LTARKLAKRPDQSLTIFRDWFGLSIDALRLGVEMQQVIGLRLLKVAAGGAAAEAEIGRMVMEKAAAFAEAGTTLASGGTPKRVLRRFRTHVRANQRRLSRKK
jgi:hypothetical protein